MPFTQIRNDNIADGAITNVKVAAGVAATKIADGTVSNSAFQRIAGLSSDVQSQINAKQASSAELTALAGMATTGFVRRTSTATFAASAISASDLGSGTANSTTFLRGDLTWATVTSGFTNPMTSVGDVIIGGASGAATRLAAGTDTHVLTLVGGSPAWAAPSAGFADPMTTNGDLIIRAAGVPSRLGVGAAGKVLGVSFGLPAWVDVPPFAAATNRILVGDVGGFAAAVAMSGDATIAASGALTLSSANVSGAGNYFGLLTIDAKGRVTAAANVMTTEGDLIVGGFGGEPDRLALGGANTVLSSDGSNASWKALNIGASASVSGTNTGDQTTVSGNAGSATVLQTARNINGVSFNGSADITITAAAGTLTGTTLASGVTASSLTSLGRLSSPVTLSTNGNNTIGSGAYGTIQMDSNNNRITGSINTSSSVLSNGGSVLTNAGADNGGFAGGAGGTITMTGGGSVGNTAGGASGSINLSGEVDDGVSGTMGAGGSINLRGIGTNNAGSINLNGGSSVSGTSIGGSLIMTGGTGNAGAGGSINTSGGSTGAGGSISTNASGANSGGAINTSGGGSGAGGSITTSNGGGSINTTGNGSIQFGASTSRVTLNGSGTTCTVTLPAATGTLALTSVATLSALTSVGTIATGTWNATIIGLAKGGTGVDLSAGGGTGFVLKQASGGVISSAALVAADIPSLDAAKITTGTLSTARLGSGTANSTTFLRGDNTWQTIAGGGDALVANPLSQFAATTSLQLAGVISDETGSGSLVFGTSPTIGTPTINTPAVSGGTIGAITSFGVRSTGASFDLKLASTEAITADRTLTVSLGDANRTLTVGASASVSGTNTGDQVAPNTLTATVDFGSSFTDKASVVVTGQAWVGASSCIVVTPKTASGVDPDEMRLLGFSWVVSDIVVGVGFTLTVFSEVEAKGTYDFSCIGV